MYTGALVAQILRYIDVALLLSKSFVGVSCPAKNPHSIPWLHRATLFQNNSHHHVHLRHRRREFEETQMT